MEYNTQRERLPMPEYGRSVQEMIDYAVRIEDRTERQRCAETIISIMLGMFPSLKDVADFQVKLWDHLAYMSGYKLDVDYPFPVTHLDNARQNPEHISYSKGNVQCRHYGKFVQELIDKAVEMPEGPEREQLTRLIAIQMKKDIISWNREMADDNRVREDIARFSNGALSLGEGSLEINVDQQNGSGQRQRQFQYRKNRKRY